MSELIDTKRFQLEVGEWHREMYPDATPSDILNKLCEEVGELNGAYQKGKWTDSPKVYEQWEEREGDAIGDIMVCLAAYCVRRNIGLDLAVDDVWNEVKNRTRERVLHAEVSRV